MTLAEHEVAQVERANADDRTPVVLVHGLWLLACSWDPWRALFEDRGYVAVAPGWPDDPDTVEAARARPDVLARKRIGMITDHYAEVIAGLTRKPVLVGHSFGGLIVQQLAGRGLSAGTVAIDPAPFRGVLPLPLSTVRSTFPVLRRPANRRRSVMLTFAQWRYALCNAIPEAEARELYDRHAVPGSGAPLFQTAVASLNPRTELTVDTRNPDRGPLLVITAEHDHIVPWAVANAGFRKQLGNPGVTQIVRMPGRGHSQVLDSGWAEVADTALNFLNKRP